MRLNRMAMFVFLLVIFATACHRNKRLTVVALPPVQPPTLGADRVSVPPPAPDFLPVPVPVPLVPELDRADRAFAGNDYDQASRLYSEYVQLKPTGSARDRALFYLGMTYVLRPATDWHSATATFKQLVDEYPQSSFKPFASMLLGLRSEADQSNLELKQREAKIKQLQTELDRYKKIDIDRRNRR